MKTRLATGVLLAGLAAHAEADVVFGTGLLALHDDTTLTTRFVVGGAAWTGVLSLTGAMSDAESATHESPLFNNHLARTGQAIESAPADAGDEFWFTYTVEQPHALRWDMRSPGGGEHFAIQQVSDTRFLLWIEDQPLNWSDRDYDDCVVWLEFDKPVMFVPAPGAVALAAAGLGLGIARRRRA